MHLNDETVAVNPARQCAGRGLSDVARVVVRENMQPAEPGWRRERLEAVGCQCGPHREAEKLMCRQAVLDALADAEFLFRIMQPDSGAFDGVDRWQGLLRGRDVSIVDAMRALQAAIRSDNRGDQRRVAADQSVIVVVVRAAAVTTNDGRPSRKTAACQVGISDLGIPRFGEKPSDRPGLARPILRGGLPGRRLVILAVASDDLVDLAAGGGVVPVLELADQDQPGSWAALVAIVRAAAVAIIKAKSILSAADRAWAMPISQEVQVDTEPRQDLVPTSTDA